MNPNLRSTIDELVRLDLRRREQDSGPLDGAQDEVEALLANLPKDEFVYVKALMHFGRGDDFGQDATFSMYLEWTARNLNDGSVAYLAGKNLAGDLTAGLQKLGIR